MDEQQTIARLRALWKSGRDKYAAFYATLNEVRREIDDDALPSWCFNNLHIGISVIIKMSDVLLETDAKIVKAELAAVVQAARKRNEQEKEKTRQEREHREIEHRKELLRKEAELAEEKERKIKAVIAIKEAKAKATEKRRTRKTSKKRRTKAKGS